MGKGDDLSPCRFATPPTAATAHRAKQPSGGAGAIGLFPRAALYRIAVGMQTDRPRIRPSRLFGVSFLTLLAAGCVAPKAPPVPLPQPAPPPIVAPPPSTTADWRDIPLTPGNWSYGAEPGGSVARFGRPGVPDFTVRCTLASRMVTLARSGAAAPTATMAVTTSAGNRALAASAAGQAIVASLPARDGFLDRMAFSRGRFVVAVAGTTRLVIPTWPEFARVVEDCRG